jgi:hypothetical protein
MRRKQLLWDTFWRFNYIREYIYYREQILLLQLTNQEIFHWVVPKVSSEESVLLFLTFFNFFYPFLLLVMRFDLGSMEQVFAN